MTNNYARAEREWLKEPKHQEEKEESSDDSRNDLGMEDE